MPRPPQCGARWKAYGVDHCCGLPAGHGKAWPTHVSRVLIGKGYVSSSRRLAVLPDASR